MRLHRVWTGRKRQPGFGPAFRSRLIIVDGSPTCRAQVKGGSSAGMLGVLCVVGMLRMLIWGHAGARRETWEMRSMGIGRRVGGWVEELADGGTLVVVMHSVHC